MSDLGFRYGRRLAALDPTDSLVGAAECRLLLLTGQSSFAHSRLEPEQTDFLHAVVPPGFQSVASGFPFHPEAMQEAGQVGLPGASVRNSLQFLWTLRSAKFAQQVASFLQPAFQQTRQKLLLLTGSCGLQMAAAAWPFLRVPETLHFRCIAIGPACLRRVPFPYVAVQSPSDWISLAAHRGKPMRVHRVAAGHMGYWRSEEARRVVAALAREGW